MHWVQLMLLHCLQKGSLSVFFIWRQTGLQTSGRWFPLLCIKFGNTTVFVVGNAVLKTTLFIWDGDICQDTGRARTFGIRSRQMRRTPLNCSRLRHCKTQVSRHFTVYNVKVAIVTISYSTWSNKHSALTERWCFTWTQLYLSSGIMLR